MLDHAGGGASAPAAPALHPSLLDALLDALLDGGDSRLRTDPATGLNKYLCPAHPAPEVAAAASCTASPIGAAGFARAAECHAALLAEGSPLRRARCLAERAEDLGTRLLAHYGAAGLARAVLCPSGTDAVLAASLALARERPDDITVILPSASETGTGVPLAAACRRFDGEERGTPLVPQAIRAVEIPTRRPDGAPFPEDELDVAYAASIRAVRGRAVVVLTHSTKTGLVAPAAPPAGEDVLVDACQARIEPPLVRAYLGRGWPVTLTGSKFFGGPAFSGAVLLPTARFGATPVAAGLGTVLRWTAAMANVEAFAARAGDMAAFLLQRAADIAAGLARIPSLVPVAGLRPGGPGWADLPSIFTFAVRDRLRPDRLLTAAELRPLYQGVAARGVLVGQPVGLGAFGGLRLAIGARDLVDQIPACDLARVFAALEQMTAPG